MIYDQHGRVLSDQVIRAPRSGMQIFPDVMSDRDSFDVSRGLTPAAVDRMMIQANGGDVEALCRLARELPEKNHDIAHAVQTRRDALGGCKWDILPGDDSSDAKRAAEEFMKVLDGAGALWPEVGILGTFSQLLRDLTDALLPGFAASEIVWRDGGKGFYGFRPVEQHHISFAKGYTPRLRTKDNWSDGVELPQAKIVFHATRRSGPDPARGGLIRPLAWLHCFSNVTLKDLLSFVERYGMPFVTAKVDQATWLKEGKVLNALIRNFGPNGGGVFSHNTELELLQAANNTGDVYFRLLAYIGDAITKVVLGQTASSGDSAGLSKGDAQSQVRQDILDADARQIEDTITRDLIAPWMRFNWGEGVALPRFQFLTDPPEDTTALAATVKTLFDAGFQADPVEMSERFGIRLERRPDPAAAAQPMPPGQAMPLEAGVEDSEAAHTLNLKQKYDAMGVAIRAGLLTATPEIEAQTRAELGLPAMTDEVKKSWQATGGIRQPITLKATEAAAVSEALDVEEGAVEMAELKPSPNALALALEAWLGPLADGILEAAETEDEAEFAQKITALADGQKSGNREAFADYLEGVIYGGIAQGMAANSKRIK